jgi:hypothetical protein
MDHQLQADMHWEIKIELILLANSLKSHFFSIKEKKKQAQRV